MCLSSTQAIRRSLCICTLLLVRTARSAAGKRIRSRLWNPRLWMSSSCCRGSVLCLRVGFHSFYIRRTHCDLSSCEIMRLYRKYDDIVTRRRCALRGHLRVRRSRALSRRPKTPTTTTEENIEKTTQRVARGTGGTNGTNKKCSAACSHGAAVSSATWQRRGRGAAAGAA